MTEVSPLSDAEWPGEIRDMLPGFAGNLDVYRLMAHHPALLRAWRDLRQHVVVDTSLELEFSEVVILRTGHRRGSDYEWGHHVSRARRLGMTEDRIAALAGPVAAMAPADAALAAAVDQLVDGARVGPGCRDAVIQLVGLQGLFDVMATVGFYTTLAYIANSFGLQLDERIRLELADDPAPGRG